MSDAIEIKLTFVTPEGVREWPLAAEPLTVGRTAGVSVVVASDSGLSRRHLTLRREGACVRAEDEHSTNGSFFNGQRIGGGGVLLSDGDEIRIGNQTCVRVSVARAPAEPQVTATAERANAGGAAGAQQQQQQHEPAQTSSALVYLIPAVAVALILLSAAALALYKVKYAASSATASRAESFDASANDGGAPEGSAPASAAKHDDAARGSAVAGAAASSPSSSSGAQSSAASLTVAPAAALPVFDAPLAVETPPAMPRLYKEMTEAEKTEFIKQRAQHIAEMMGNRHYAFPPDAIALIKKRVDTFAARTNSEGTRMWRGSTVAVVERGRGYAPTIIRAFQERNVPIVIGLYIPFIETEYTNVSSNNSAGAAGLFQFLGPTAEGYGVPAAERTNVDKMSVAAAKYYRDNLQRFGNDPMGVALSVAGYNRAPESVLRDLRNVAAMGNNEDKERTFWSLVANKKSLDEKFQNENADYVPRFFAAAIFGETPWAFGVKGNPLSTYMQPASPAAASNQISK